MDFILEDLARVKPDVIVQAGDIFDSRSSIEDRNYFAAWLAEIKTIAPFWAVAGNHDVAGDLEVFNYVGGPHEHRIWEAPASREVGGVLVLGLPHIDKGSLVTDGSISDSTRASEDQIRGFLTTAFRGRVVVSESPSILIAHADVAGRVLSNGETRPHQGITLTVEDLIATGVDYVALGHIHKQQRLHERVWYAGSVARANFGEPDEKGYLLVRLGPKGALPVVEPRPIPCRPMVTVTSTWTDDGWETRGAEAITEDAEIRILLKAPEDFAANLATAQAEVLERYPSAQVETEIIPGDRKLRSEAIATAETPEDLLRAYWDASEAPPLEFQAKALVTLAAIVKEIAA